MILGFYNLYIRLQVSKPGVKLNDWVFSISENPCCTIFSELFFLPIHSRKLRTGSHHRRGGEGCAGQPPLSRLENIAIHLQNKNQICQVPSAFSHGVVWITEITVLPRDSEEGWASGGDQQGQYSRIKVSVTENSASRNRVQELGHY